MKQKHKDETENVMWFKTDLEIAVALCANFALCFDSFFPFIIATFVSFCWHLKCKTFTLIHLQSLFTLCAVAMMELVSLSITEQKINLFHIPPPLASILSEGDLRSLAFKLHQLNLSEGHVWRIYRDISHSKACPPFFDMHSGLHGFGLDFHVKVSDEWFVFSLDVNCHGLDLFRVYQVGPCTWVWRDWGQGGGENRCGRFISIIFSSTPTPP